MFRGTKTDYGDGPDDQKYSEKKERPPADEDSHSHHRVCGKTVHRQHTLQDFRVLTPEISGAVYRIRWIDLLAAAVIR